MVDLDWLVGWVGVEESRIELELGGRYEVKCVNESEVGKSRLVSIAKQHTKLKTVIIITQQELGLINGD